MPTTKKPTTKKSTVAKPVEQPASPLAPRNHRWVIVTGGSVIVGLMIIVVGYLGYEYSHKDKVYPGVQLAEESLAGKTYPEVVDIITEYKNELNNTGLQFAYQDQTYTITPRIQAEDSAAPDVHLVTVDTDATAQDIFGYGRRTSTSQNLREKLGGLFTTTTIPLRYEIDQATVRSLLESEFGQHQIPYVNADVEFTNNEVTFTEHSDGQRFDWEMIVQEIEQRLSQLEPVTITLELTPDPAVIPTGTAQTYQPEIEDYLVMAPFTLTYEDKAYEVDVSEFQNWLTITEVGVDIDEEVIDIYLDEIAGDIDIAVKEGRFSLDVINDEVKLTQFEDGADGLAVNGEETINTIREYIFERGETTIPLVVEVTHPRATPDNLDDLGITELLGTGTTNFAGSPANRRFNIQKGADLLNGLLIAPDEEFSLLSVLNPIDLEHGWLSELVIKGDKLEKEAGGGLCQIGSTVFRATMNSGLDITERKNHSWAVSYYNYNGKAGVDATIYDPSPDYKFVNNTEHWILIRSRIEGSDIFFDFWGTSDGRKGYFTEPTNYAVIYPGPTEKIVDETKPVGYIDCPTHAFVGKTASFDYIIEYLDGTSKTRNFTSTYKPQNERCVVGPEAEENSEGSTDDTADNVDDATDNITDESVNDTDTTEEDTNTNSNTNNSNKKKDKKKKE